MLEFMTKVHVLNNKKKCLVVLNFDRLDSDEIWNQNQFDICIINKYYCNIGNILLDLHMFSGNSFFFFLAKGLLKDIKRVKKLKVYNCTEPLLWQQKNVPTAVNQLHFKGDNYYFSLDLIRLGEKFKQLFGEYPDPK